MAHKQVRMVKMVKNVIVILRCIRGYDASRPIKGLKVEDWKLKMFKYFSKGSAEDELGDGVAKYSKLRPMRVEMCLCVPV